MAQLPMEGHFELKLKGNSNMIVISLIGYKRLEAKVGGSSGVYTLQVDEQSLNDVVVVGYQSQNRREVTAAVSSIKGKDIYATNNSLNVMPEDSYLPFFTLKSICNYIIRSL